MLIKRYRYLNMIENCVNFLKLMKDLKLYMLNFKKYKTIKTKVYLDNYIIKIQNWGSIKIIIYDIYIFFANNSI